jgi:hypothetical protein
MTAFSTSIPGKWLVKEIPAGLEERKSKPKGSIGNS